MLFFLVFHAALSRGFVDGAFGEVFAFSWLYFACISYSRIRFQILCFTAFKCLDFMIIVCFNFVLVSVPLFQRGHDGYPELGNGVFIGDFPFGVRWSRLREDCGEAVPLGCLGLHILVSTNVRQLFWTWVSLSALLHPSDIYGQASTWCRPTCERNTVHLSSPRFHDVLAQTVDM